MTPDVRELLRFLRVPGFRYREFGAHPAAVPATWRQQRAGFTIVALVSLVRGTGRTTLAANLASALARRGLRAAALDLDPAAQLGAHFEHDTAAGDESAALVRWTSSGAGLVPYGRDPALAMESLAADCDVALLDTAAGVSEAVELAMAEADEVLIVVGPDDAGCASVAPTEALLSRARRSWRRTRARYLVNRFDGRRHADRAALASLRRTLGARLLSPPVQEDEAVRTALAVGRPIHEEAPGSQVVADLDAIASEWLPARERTADRRVRKAKDAL